jgi:16S rRNA (guanine966-N2)-methyltransferase
MRIIAGSSKGRPLKAVPGINTRPTTDKVKEAIFSSLGISFSQKWALDLFAGTGGLGIEAISRGIEKAIFIDRDPKAVAVIKENLKAAGFAERAEVYRNDADRAIKALAKRGIPFDLVFLDPPYRLRDWDRWLSGLTHGKLLSPEGMVVCEHDAFYAFPDPPAPLSLWKDARYGDTHITFLRNGHPAEGEST